MADSILNVPFALRSLGTISNFSIIQKLFKNIRTFALIYLSPYFQVYGMQPSDFVWGTCVEDNTQCEETHVPARLAVTQISTLKAVQKKHD
jgi:hypothetical protein